MEGVFCCPFSGKLFPFLSSLVYRVCHKGHPRLEDGHSYVRWILKSVLVKSAKVKMKLTMIAVICLALVVPGVGQTGTRAGESSETKTPRYEIVSVRSNKSSQQLNLNQNDLPDGFSARHSSLWELIGMAYTGTPFLLDSQVKGAPSWFKSERFDIEAKVDGSDLAAMKKIDAEDALAAAVAGVPTTRMRMLQGLLADRFKLKTHYEMKELPVYALVVAKGGPKLKESGTTDPTKVEAGFSDGRIDGKNTPLVYLPFMLMPQLERTVIDRTDLKAYYDFELHWTPDGRSGEDVGIDAPPGLFTAIQEQLGLKLEATKGPVKVLVIDHVERPSEN